MTKMEINVLTEYVRAWIVAHELNEKFLGMDEDEHTEEEMLNARAQARTAKIYRDRIMNGMIKGYVSKNNLNESFEEINAILSNACEAMDFKAPTLPINYFFWDILGV